MTCANCKSGALEVVLDLGEQVPANAYTTPSLAPLRMEAPLQVALCSLCGLAQLTEESLLPPEALFTEYAYRTGGAAPLLSHLAGLASHVGGPGKRVIEVGSNDGIFLALVKRRTNAQILGVDPARNLALEANLNGIPTLPEFFGVPIVNLIAETFGPGVDAIVARNVVAHMSDLGDFLMAAGDLLKNDGSLYIEVPWVADMIRGDQIDQVYHEHRYYFGVRSLGSVLEKYGFRIVDVTKVGLHGGSILCEAKSIHSLGRPSDTVEAALREEKSVGVYDPEVWRGLMKRAREHRAAFLGLLYEYGRRGEKIMGYTAPAKGSVWLQFCGVQSGLLPGIYDTTAEKQGRLVPGTDIPILDPIEMEEDCPVALIVFAWNWLPHISQLGSLLGKRLIKPYGWTTPASSL